MLKSLFRPKLFTFESNIYHLEVGKKYGEKQKIGFFCMKIFKYVIAFLPALLFTSFYGMKRELPEAPIFQVQFTPQEDIKKELFSFLESAEQQVVIAMYWITDASIVDKLVSLKQKGINIKIIFDESSSGHMEIVNKLVNANILPLIFPSARANQFMHNKFLIADSSKVFTGSANFTRRVFNSNNYENIIIINSVDIAQQYLSAFDRIEQATFELYVDWIANSSNPNKIPAWAQTLIPLIYQKDERFQETLRARLPGYDRKKQERLGLFFNVQLPEPIQPRRPRSPITRGQKAYLQSLKYRRSMEHLSRREASGLIDQIKAEQARSIAQPEESATPSESK